MTQDIRNGVAIYLSPLAIQNFYLLQTRTISFKCSERVPFPFDVHGMIFSDNAATLETDLHKQFSDSRVNKVNARKEYFRVNIDTLEQAVFEHDPAAEFTRTALAEQYRQTLSLEAAGLTQLEDESDLDIDDE